MRTFVVVSTLAACLGIATFAHAQERAPRFRAKPFERGLYVASQICAECHAIYRDRTESPHPLAPTFREIAATPGLSRAALLVALRTSHVTMPNLMLTENDARAVATYILSLRRAR